MRARYPVLGVDNRSAEFRDVKEDIGVVLDEAYFPEVMSARNVGKVMALTYKNWDAASFEGYLKSSRSLRIRYSRTIRAGCA